MSLKEELNTTLTAAMKARDETRKIPLRLVMAAIKEAEIEKQADLDDDQVLGILQKEVKARLESIADAEKSNRPDLIEAAKAEMAVLKEFLPQPLSEEKIIAIVKETIAEVGAASMADMGAVMGALLPKVQGRADGGQLSKIVRQQLNA